MELDLDEDNRLKTGHYCSGNGCQEPLLFEDEVFLLLTEYPKIEDHFHLELAVDQHGDYLYEPCFFCFSCWERAEEDLRERTVDVPPISDDYGILECSVCQSSIRLDEIMGTVQLGELQYSQRAPDEKLAPKFKVNGDKKIVCIDCLQKLNTDIVDTLWVNPVQQVTECSEGISLRCWRHGCPATEDDCQNKRK